MNLYDEAIERLNTPIVHDTIYGVYEGYMLSEEERGVVSKALERAKKEHELLGLYQKKEQCIVCAPLFKDSSILHCVVRYSEDEKYMRILKQIKGLEEELK